MPGARPIAVDMHIAQATTVDEDGWIMVQPDGYGEEGSGFHEMICPQGFIARPLDPDVDEHQTIKAGTPLVSFIEGGKWLEMPLTDKRVMTGLPTLKKGESMQYGSRYNFVRCYDNGFVGIFASDDMTANGQSIQWDSGPTGQHYSAPWGTQFYDATGYHIRTTSGARLDLGGIGGLPAPMSALSSYFIVGASTVKMRASIVALGPDGGVFDAAAKATPTLALITAVQAVLTALASPGGVIATTGPCTFGPAVAPALTALAAALTAAQATLPAVSVTVA